MRFFGDSRPTLVAVALLAAVEATAQTPAPQSAPQAAERGAVPAPYTYEAGGRRDPFLSLVGGGMETGAPGANRAEGAAGLTVGEINLRGIVQSRGTLIAMIQGPDNKTYLVHQGDRFVDGTLKSITAQGLVIVQELHDPLSLVKQREIHKQLRSAQGAKP
jgi:hypothetical protein